MKRLIIAILLFVIGCIIIGVIKQEYLIHKLLSQLSFNDSEVILYRIFSYSGYIVNIAISISVLLIISLLSFFVLMFIEGDKFCFEITHRAFLHATSALFILTLGVEIVKLIVVLYSNVDFIALYETDKEIYNHYSNILTMRYMRCDLIGGLMGFIIYFLTLHKKLPSLSFWKFLPNMFLYLTIFFYLYFRQLS